MMRLYKVHLPISGTVNRKTCPMTRRPRTNLTNTGAAAKPIIQVSKLLPAMLNAHDSTIGTSMLSNQGATTKAALLGATTRCGTVLSEPGLGLDKAHGNSDLEHGRYATVLTVKVVDAAILGNQAPVRLAA